MLAFLIKGCVAVLKRFPDFNSSIDPEGGAVIRKNYWHIGFAADTPQGLVVPVVKDADKKGIFEIAQETSALAAKARDGKLGPAEMAGRHILDFVARRHRRTSFTPIINAPEVAITRRMPIDDEAGLGRQAVRSAAGPALSLSWDHRVVDVPVRRASTRCWRRSRRLPPRAAVVAGSLQPGSMPP